jgi:hypothetical protein
MVTITALMLLVGTVVPLIAGLALMFLPGKDESLEQENLRRLMGLFLMFVGCILGLWLPY